MFNIEFVDLVLSTRDGVEFPENLGTIYIGLTSCFKRRNIDFKTSIALGKEVLHPNFHTDGKIAKIVYSKYGIGHLFKYNKIYGFKAHRTFARGVPKALKSGAIIYRDIIIPQSTYKINVKEDLSSYNEFDIWQQ